MLASVGLVLTVALSDYAAGDLHKAVREGNIAEMKRLLDEEGADINEVGPGGQTVLMHGVLGGCKACVKLALEKDADTTIGEQDGYTPMHGAAFQGRPHIAKMLIDHGLDPQDVHKDGYQPIHRACWGKEQRHADTLQVFLDNGVPHDSPSKEGHTPIEMAPKGYPTHKLLWELLRDLEEAEEGTKKEQKPEEDL
eukprot:TRINITY_DN19848_c0_g1_i1.p1 TRINITY_DN19848_c0_g1~~TRINITY_DN19848_c0_g1_i1.p1  ORF type:complete len:195 (+),score=44.27 TRINITY_DN19848_c0_g1_i1:58-642(+)